jgi:hypothetical protein
MRPLLLILLASVVAACVNREIVKPPESRRLASEEIAAGLASGNFREVLGARAQLDGLRDDDWFAALAPMAHDSLPQHRLVATIELSRRSLAAARALLTALARDPDETVRTEAQERLAVAAASGGAP